ncbi:FAD/NAD(P)-binding oxidoreductase [Streptomyces sp. NPDC051976]|uniref:FAD/NAD(P)-dependent oxidoreductase n=1 Tax=Streptomyces sp. NPDC051976 TaxID=3154947 RepID=UPI003421041A
MGEVLVIGAGPAGLAAAVCARGKGADVVLLDADDGLGGQYWRHLPASRPSRREAALHHGWQRFLDLRGRLADDPGCRILTGAQVWALEQRDGRAPTVHVLAGEADGARRTPLTFTPDALVLATGAHDRTLPFPGWDLPGVFTAGAAQAMAKGERVAVGRRVVVAGAGPFLLPVARSLAQTGARVAAVVEASGPARLAAGWLPRPWQLLGAAGKIAELGGYARSHLRHRIPYRTGAAVVAAHGDDRVTAVTVADLDPSWAPVPGTERRVVADAVCVSHGFVPRLELAVAAGCRITAHRTVAVDDAQRTSVPGVFAAGEITGIGGVDLALAEGALAGHCAAGGTPGDPVVRAAAGRRRVFTGFAARIEAAHGIRPGWTAWLDDTTTVCRCEEVTAGTLRDVAAATRSQGLRSLKLSTRAALGICQGRVCGRTVEELLAGHAPGGALLGATTTDRRPLAAPVRLAELASPPTAGPPDPDHPASAPSPPHPKGTP